MKSLSVYIILIFLTIQINAQHFPLVSQFEENKNLINPAAVIEDDLKVNLFYRNQWLGFDNSPKIIGLNSLMKYRNMNFGLFILNDKAGIFEQNTIHLNYAYALKLNETLSLSFGISGGLDIYALNYQDLNMNQDNDPFILANKNNTPLPDFNIGLYLHSNTDEEKEVFSSNVQRKFYAGFSIQHILDVITENQVAKNDSYLLKHYNFMGGYLFPAGSDLGIEMNFLLKYVSNVPFQGDIGFRAIYKNQYWAGLTYRSSNDIIMKLGLYISNKILIAYSFDLVTSNIPNKTSHEFILGYKINKGMFIPKY